MRLKRRWYESNKIVLYGYGAIAHKGLKFLERDFEILFIIDNGEIKEQKTGIPIYSLIDVKDKIKGEKIVICSVGENYNSMEKSLIELGLVVNEDYCGINVFIAEWYWKNKNEVCLLEVHTSITTRCTLRCQNCNMFMPYYKEPQDYKKEDIKRDLDLLFRSVSKVFSYHLLGGEPFLNRELCEILEYLCENYKDRIGEISIITNGTVIPEKKVLKLIKENAIMIYISDYTSVVSYRKKFDKFVELLEQYGIKYKVNQELKWCDFHFPKKQMLLREKYVREHMLNCNPIFRGVNDGKYYFCHVSWSIEKCKMFHLEGKDYINLEEIKTTEDKEKLLHFSLGEIDGDYVSFCRVCGGCGSDNKDYVTAGEQYKGSSL